VKKRFTDEQIIGFLKQIASMKPGAIHISGVRKPVFQPTERLLKMGDSIDAAQLKSHPLGWLFNLSRTVEQCVDLHRLSLLFSLSVFVEV
jgi:hypothetical protein